MQPIVQYRSLDMSGAGRGTASDAIALISAAQTKRSCAVVINTIRRGPNLLGSAQWTWSVHTASSKPVSDGVKPPQFDDVRFVKGMVWKKAVTTGLGAPFGLRGRLRFTRRAFAIAGRDRLTTVGKVS